MFTRKSLTGITLCAVLFSVLYAPIQNVQAQGGSSDIQSHDGQGNNIAHPDWGSAGQQFLRMSEAAYADGIGSPAGADRPSARTISNTFSVSPEDGILNDRDCATCASQ